MDAARSTFQQDIQAIRQAASFGHTWTDTSFEGPAAFGCARLESYVAAWLRPSELAAVASLLGAAEGEASLGSVEQGPLADCWFLGALSTVVARGGVASILGDTSYVQCGVYVFRFFKGGEEVNVAVDERLPCSNDRLPAFARCAADPAALWAPLAEKAYAKLHRCYASLREGAEADALADLTGGPAWLGALQPPSESAGAGASAGAGTGASEEIQRPPAANAALLSHLRRGGLAGLSLFEAPPPKAGDQEEDEAGSGSGPSPEAEDPLEFTVNIPLCPGSPPERLCFGRTQPAVAIAERFVKEHGLPQEAVPQIRAFVDAQRTAPVRTSGTAAKGAHCHVVPNHSYTVLRVVTQEHSAAGQGEGQGEGQGQPVGWREEELLLSNPWGGVGVPNPADTGVDAARQPSVAGQFLASACRLGHLFNAVHFCMPALLTVRLAQATGTWRADASGYAANPQFELRLCGLDEVLVLLRHSCEPRLMGKRNDFKAIGFDIFRPEVGEAATSPGRLTSPEQLPAVAWSPFLAARQVCEAFKAGPGKHTFVVVPRQYGSASRDVHFQLEIHAVRQMSTSVAAAPGQDDVQAADQRLRDLLRAEVEDPDLAEALRLSSTTKDEAWDPVPGSAELLHLAA